MEFGRWTYIKDVIPTKEIIAVLTHWGRGTHICVGNLAIIGSENGLSPSRRQAIIWTNAGILLIGPLETNFSEILIEILTFSFKKMRMKVSSAKWRPFCLGLNMLNLNDGRIRPSSWSYRFHVEKILKIWTRSNHRAQMSTNAYCEERETIYHIYIVINIVSFKWMNKTINQY